MFKKIVLLSVIVLASVGVANAGGNTKVLMCHKTSSETNPVVLISVSTNAIDAQLAQGSTIAVQMPDGSYFCELDPGPLPE